MNEEYKSTFLEGLKQLPPAFQDWVASLGWKLEDITSFETHREILRDLETEDKKADGWKYHKPGPHITTKVSRGNEEHEAKFNVSTGEWKLEKSSLVTARDTQFYGFAEKLVEELFRLNALGTRTYVNWGDHIEQIIARRVYDFACHVVDSRSPHISHVPDMTELPKEEA